MPRFPWNSHEFDRALRQRFDPESAEVARLSAALCAVPGVTVPHTGVDFEALQRTFDIARTYAESHGLHVTEHAPTPSAPYPFLVVGFAAPDTPGEAIALMGHLDVVPPRAPNQFEPYLDGDDLIARGAADMKTVVATSLVWMARAQGRPGPKPPFLVLLSGCEENGSERPHHMGTALDWLEDRGVTVRFAVVGERTGELEWMPQDTPVGPICKENRGWRWLRSESGTARGLAALHRIARAVGSARAEVHRLNTEAIPASKRDRQPGVRSGFVNPYAFVPGDPGDDPTSSWLQVGRPAGASVHSASLRADSPSLVERLDALARGAEEAFGAGSVSLVGLGIGEDDNFNSYDGSGTLVLRVRGPDAATLERWAGAAADPDLEVRAGSGPREALATSAVVGLDVRELLDHKAAVHGVLEGLRQQLWDGPGMRGDRDRPPWRCPADHPDLVRLEAAWAAVVGHPSPDLVKLHGNDGGTLAGRQQDRSAELAARGVGHAVVFGQVGKHPHGAGELHRLTSVRPYLDILDHWAAATLPSSVTIS